MIASHIREYHNFILPSQLAIHLPDEMFLNVQTNKYTWSLHYQNSSYTNPEEQEEKYKSYWLDHFAKKITAQQNAQFQKIKNAKIKYQNAKFNKMLRKKNQYQEKKI